ncbi:hypothetical protein V4F30_22230 [Rhodococcus sp. IITD102]|uniref:hypothetical protein n=1 Tax=Rhodococcus TaxID=1827 RepID=UPI0026F45988|nr:hypothetical protein [Rhodococcus ruber]MDO2379820.1 hypothetical protein [Rhodococcus ruber]
MTNDPTVAAITARLARNGLPIPTDITTRVESRIPGHTLAGLEGDPETRVLVSAWQSSRRGPKSDEVAWIILLELFREQFDRELPGLRTVLGAQRMGLTRTQVEVRRQLGSRYFHLGRSLAADKPAAAVGSYLLTQAVTVLMWVHDKQPRLRDDEKRIYHSQIATASVILARRTKHPAELSALLNQAQEHSQLAENLGDHDENHYAYLAEIHLRRFALTRDASPLPAVLDTLDSRGGTTRRLRGARADLRLDLGLAEIRDGHATEGVRSLHRAESEYTNALHLDEDSGAHTGYLLAKRGQARYTLYRFDSDADGRRQRAHLDDALADWLDPQAKTHIAGDVIVEALLDRARIHLRANNPLAAEKDRETARDLLSEPSPNTMAKLRNQDFEHTIDNAIDSDDLARVAEAVDDILALPAETAIPAAALMRACRVLLASRSTELELDEHNDRTRRALDRLELEIDHPALDATGRRHVAGHAALLSWLLTRRTNDNTAGLARTVELYRRSFGAVDHHPSVDALANAGACALTLARQLLASDETDAEQAASLLTEAVTWTREALTLVTAKPDLAPESWNETIAHGRLGEAAIRSYSITWNLEHLELAVTHLQTIRDAGQDAVEPTGLLADAYYRRGLRNHDIEDLHRAVQLKDEAFDNGNTVRENRSVTAAIALRLCTITSDNAHLTDAAQRALQAAQCDPLWPWAVLQLAAIAPESQHLDHDVLTSQPPHELTKLLLAGDRRALTAHAAQLAVSTTEFRTSILGGQLRTGEQGVRVINDPHRLIERAVVLKRLSRDAANQERDDTEAFQIWLQAQNCPPGWTLPEPLAVVDVDDDDAVYVMSRAQGRVLGACVVTPRYGEEQQHLPRFREALRYLAAYQGWRWTTDPKPSGATDAERTAFDCQLDKASRKLQLGPAAQAELSRALEFVARSGAPVVAKKDPHPGNWLWTHNDELVLIDLESSINLPLLQEAVTVIDDLPLLDTANPTSWETRLEIARDYCTSLREFGIPLQHLSDTDLKERYEALAALHAIKGLGRVRNADPGVSLFAAETIHLQTTHYLGLLDYLAASAHSMDIRRLTGTVALHIGRVESSRS